VSIVAVILCTVLLAAVIGVCAVGAVDLFLHPWWDREAR
jgi:FlaG/FlaF family flagellin (archaellin)